jgi:hypothetical protein
MRDTMHTESSPDHQSLPDNRARYSATPSWSQRYGERHRLVRVLDFPAGIVGPEKVRLYRRHDHYVLQWWDPAAKTNLSDRVQGDLVAAIARARQIEERLTHFKASGQVRHRHLRHADLLEAFLTDLQRRADAGGIDPATVRRYRSALHHYLAFCEDPSIAKAYPHAMGVNREFRLKLAAFLAQRSISPNGHAHAAVRTMRGQRFVLDTVRALYEWAADPERGQLLPEGFRNPFLRASETRSLLKGDPLAEPDITLGMAIDLVTICDRFQLRLFVPMLLFGLRAAEPCFLFTEYLDGNWLRVPCNADLGYSTKGRRDKRFPLIDDLQPYWEELQRDRAGGLLYERRGVLDGSQRAPLRGASLAEVATEYRRRCLAKPDGSAERQRLRDAVLREAGALTYDQVEGEFKALARGLRWPTGATLKDLRHLFATTMNNASMPEAYRRYLMGQAPGKAAVVAYTHLNELRRHYTEAVHREWQPLVEAILHRLSDLLNNN